MKLLAAACLVAASLVPLSAQEVAAAKKWQFKPGMKDGKPVPCK